LVPAIQALFNQCGKPADGLVLLRFQLRGFAIFSKEYELFDEPEPPAWDDVVWTERFCSRLSSVWRYSDATVPPAHILHWLTQFDDAGFGREARELLVYLFRYGYVTEQKITTRMTDVYRELGARFGFPPIAVAFQEPGKSESKLAYKLRPSISFVTPDNAIELARSAKASNVLNFVCFDDCVGSGETVEKYLFRSDYNSQVDEFKDLYSSARARLYVVVYHSDSRGVRRIEEHPAACGAVVVQTISPLDATHKVFSDDSRIIDDPARRADFKDFCMTVGEELFPGNSCSYCVRLSPLLRHAYFVAPAPRKVQ
jgi:hypothetical protein